MIQATVVLDADYSVRVYRILVKKWNRVLMPLCGLIGGVFLPVMVALNSKVSPAKTCGGILLLIIMGCFVGTMPWTTEWSIRRAARRKPVSSALWRISAEGVSLEGIHGHSFVQWEGLNRVVPKTDGLIIYSGPKALHWITATAFASTEEFQAAVRLVPGAMIAKK